jgi:hypothetical protein
LLNGRERNKFFGKRKNYGEHGSGDGYFGFFRY